MLCLAHRIFGSSLILASLGISSTAAQEKPSGDQLRVLIVTGFDVGVHKWRDTTLQTMSILEQTGRFQVRACEDIGIFESSSLANYDAVVLNYGFWEAPDPSPQAKQGMLEYVRGGKGIVALHFACSAFQDWQEYETLLGRVWKKGVGGHGPRGPFKVQIIRTDHPITRGLTDFEADDELYAKLSGNAQIEVLASAYSDWSNQEEPIVYVKRYGKGNVVHNLLGHDVRARENPAFQALLCRGVEFAALGKVTQK